MRYLHTMVRVGDLDAALDFYCAKLGLKELRRIDNTMGRFNAGVSRDARGCAERQRRRHSHGRADPQLDEKEYSGGRNFGHLAYRVGDIYAVCKRLMDGGVTINRPPRDGNMAFVRSPDGISIELLQEGNALPPQEPWASMPNVGSW